jgi:hypothetical protein
MQFRGLKGYTPGTTGTAGTFTKAKTIFGFYLFNPAASGTNYDVSVLQCPKDTQVDYYIYCDKSRLIMFTKLPNYYSYAWQMTYIGIPDTLYAPFSDGNGVIYFQQPTVNQADYASGVPMIEHPDVAQTTPVADNVFYFAQPYVMDCFFFPTRNNKFFASEVYLYNAAYGFFCKMDGFLVTEYYGTGVSSGTKFTIGSDTYTFLQTYATGSCYYNTSSYSQYHAFGLPGVGLLIKVSE